MSPAAAAPRALPARRLAPNRPRPSIRKRRVLAVGIALLAVGCGRSADAPPPNATADELVSWGGRRLDAGDPAQATVAYRRALLQDSLHAEALAGLARSYDLQGKAGPADSYRSRAFDIYYTRGLALIAAGQRDSARVALEAAGRVMPRHPLVPLRLGELQASVGRLDSAIAQFEQAVELNPRYSESLVALGKAYAQAGRDGEARRAFERAVQANVNAFDAYVGLGELFIRLQEWALAASQFEKALLIDPRSEKAHLGLDQVRARL